MKEPLKVREHKIPEPPVELPYEVSEPLVNKLKHKLVKHTKNLDIVDCNEWNDSE